MAHNLGIQFPIERLDLNSMIQQKFVSSWADLNNISYEITFFNKSWWRVGSLIDLSICMHLFCLTLMPGKDGHSWRMSSTYT
jgi:hypothetical protein